MGILSGLYLNYIRVNYTFYNRKGVMYIMKSIVKGVIVVAIGIPVSIIGMSVASTLVRKYSKKNTKQS